MRVSKHDTISYKNRSNRTATDKYEFKNKFMTERYFENERIQNQ